MIIAAARPGRLTDKACVTGSRCFWRRRQLLGHTRAFQRSNDHPRIQAAAPLAVNVQMDEWMSRFHTSSGVRVERPGTRKTRPARAKSRNVMMARSVECDALSSCSATTRARRLQRGDVRGVGWDGMLCALLVCCVVNRRRKWGLWVLDTRIRPVHSYSIQASLALISRFDCPTPCSQGIGSTSNGQRYLLILSIHTHQQNHAGPSHRLEENAAQEDDGVACW